MAPLWPFCTFVHKTVPDGSTFVYFQYGNALEHCFIGSFDRKTLIWSKPYLRKFGWVHFWYIFMKMCIFSPNFHVISIKCTHSSLVKCVHFSSPKLRTFQIKMRACLNLSTALTHLGECFMVFYCIGNSLRNTFYFIWFKAIHAQQVVRIPQAFCGEHLPCCLLSPIPVFIFSIVLVTPLNLLEVFFCSVVRLIRLMQWDTSIVFTTAVLLQLIGYGK